MPRKDRGPDQLRNVTLVANFTEHAEGSVLASFGRTRVLCTATAEERVPGYVKGSGRGWVTAEYGMLPRSTHTRTGRGAAKGKQSGRTQEIQRLIGRSLRAAVDLQVLGERQGLIDCDVLQGGGGPRTPGVPRAYVGGVWGVSGGMLSGQALLDLDYEEDFAAEVDMNVVGNAAGELLEVQGTAEKRPFTTAQLSAMVGMAQKGLAELHQKKLAATAGAFVK